MATLYITSTASTGTGTLRALITSAANGDVITPDSSRFVNTKVNCVLSTSVTSTKAVSLIGNNGRNTRLQITGSPSDSSTYVNLTLGSNSTSDRNYECEISDVDFVNLTRSSAGPIYIYYGTPYVIKRCRAVGCTGSNSAAFFVRNTYGTQFYDCAVYGNRATATTGQVATAFYFWSQATTNAMYRCTYGGNVSTTSGTSGAFRYTPSDIGDYVSPTYEDEWKSPPPSTYEYSTWTKYSWQGMDPRPTSTSSFRTGSSTSSSDILDLNGRARKTNGAKGAFEYFDALASPEIVTATERDSDGFKISWSAVENATGYRVTIVSQGETPYTETIETSQYSWVFTGLEPLTTYDVSVVAFDPYYDDSEPTTIEATTATDALGRLSSPIFRGTGVYSDYIWVEWNVPERAAFIRVTVYEGAASESNVLYRNTFEAYDEVNEASVVNDISFYPPASGTYVVGFKAFPSVADSATYLPSLENTASFEYEAPSFITLDTPTNLAASNITDTSATLSWNAVANASGYVVEWRASGASSWNSETVN